MSKREIESSKNQKQINASDQFFREIELEFLIHELKDPLSIIESNMRMLLKRSEKYGPYSSGLEKILQRSLRNSMKASNMLYSLLEIGKSRAGNAHTVKCKADKLIVDSINETLELLQDYVCMETERIECEVMVHHFSDFGVQLNVTERVKQTTIHQDLIKIKQILGNVLKNALHYRVKIVTIDSDIVDDHLVIDVIDDGPGIEPEYRELIFERYAQVKACDSEIKRNKHGLGLAAARIMARYVGGDIVIKSTKNRGANFKINLPVEI